MSAAETALLLLFLAAAAPLAALAAAATLAFVVLPNLDRRPTANGPTTPRVTVLIAARDEQDRIADTVRLALDQPEVARVIVADDRSTDDTPDILRSIAQGDPRLTPVRIDRLPEGWIGKSNALQTALNHAPDDPSAEYVLCIDADTHLAPGVLGAALRIMERPGSTTAHVAALPGFDAESPLAAAAAASLYQTFIARAAATNLRLPVVHVGVGAFTLTRKRHLESIGGFRPVRLEILDDVRLALLLNRAGHRTTAAFAARSLHIDWPASPRKLAKLLEKNAFALIGLSVWRVLALAAPAAVCLTAGALGWTTLLLPLHPAAQAAGVLCTAAFLADAVPCLLFMRRAGWPLAAFPLAPFFKPLGIAILVNSMRTTLRNKGVTWRETHYPLATLRQHRVR